MLHASASLDFGHVVSGRAAKGEGDPLVDALLNAGADVDFQMSGEDGKKGDTPLIGAASLGAEEVGLRLLAAGAKPDVRGLFGETALHWAALLGEDRLVAELIRGSDVNLKDEKYNSSPLGWAIQGGASRPQEITAGNVKWSLSWLLREQRLDVSGWNVRKFAPMRRFSRP